MPKKRLTAEQIMMLRRQIEVSMAQGKPTPVACPDAEISLASIVNQSQFLKRINSPPA